MQILIVEDEPRMLELLRKGLYEHGFAVMTAADGETGLEIAIGHEFDAIILDIGLPKLDGYGVMHTLRARSRGTPVLMLTARDTEDEIIRGLDLGADDYLTKPFSFPELVARLQSITRHRRNKTDGMMEAGGVVADCLRRSVKRDGRNIDLSPHEFQLLICLMRSAGHCVSRLTLTEAVWGKDRSVSATALDVLINSLRSKIDSAQENRLIGTVRGAGYFFKDSLSGEERTS